MCEFHVGQKVVCIDDVFQSFHNLLSERAIFSRAFSLVKGRVYTIDMINYVEKSDFIKIPFFGIRLCELPSRGDLDFGYASQRFAPIKETDISIFRAMLNPSRETIKKFMNEEELV